MARESALRFPGRKLLFMLMLSTMMLPGIVTQIPTFVYFSKLGWVNTWYPLIHTPALNNSEQHRAAAQPSAQ